MGLLLLLCCFDIISYRYKMQQLLLIAVLPLVLSQNGSFNIKYLAICFINVGKL